MTRIDTVYGQALYTLARDEGLDAAIAAELETLREIFTGEPDYLRLLAAPNLPKQERCQILDDAFRGKVHPYVLNFLKLLTEKGYIRQFGGCVKVYREQFNQDHGILPVTAVTAVPLSQAQHQRLKEKLAAITGKQVALYNRVDPAALGGVRLDYDGKRVEDTVAHRLETVRAMLKNTVL